MENEKNQKPLSHTKQSLDLHGIWFNSSLTTSLKFGFGMLILSGMANEQLKNLSHKPFISGHFHIGRLMRAAMAGINLWQPPWMIGSLQTEGHVFGQYIT